MAVRLPVVVGLVEKVTMSKVAVAEVTVPTAPLLKTTTLWEAIGSKPKPLIVTAGELGARLVIALVRGGAMFATWTAAPLVCELVVTAAVKLPRAVGFVEKVTVSEVAVAAVTVPTAPLLKTTVLCEAVGSN